MPTTVAVTFTAMPSSGGDGNFYIEALHENGSKRALPPFWALDLNREHHTIQRGNWLKICKTTLLGSSLSSLLA
jgi:hypothetical protein